MIHYICGLYLLEIILIFKSVLYRKKPVQHKIVCELTYKKLEYIYDLSNKKYFYLTLAKIFKQSLGKLLLCAINPIEELINN